jgi:hypothetical protein
MNLPTHHRIISRKKDSRSGYAQFLHFRPLHAVMEEILFWQRERENVWTRPGYGIFGEFSTVTDTIKCRVGQRGGISMPCATFTLYGPRQKRALVSVQLLFG